MRCPQCATELPASAKFCLECGEHLAAARAMYGEMGMTYWLERLDRSRVAG